MRRLDGITNTMDMDLGGWTPGVGDGHGAWRAVIHGVVESQTRLSD